MQPTGNRTTETLRFQIRSKDVLAPDEAELFELTQLAGIRMDANVFKIILDLLRLNVAPMAIMQMLKLMCDPKEQKAAAEGHSYMSTSSDSLSLHNRSATSRQQSSIREKQHTAALRDAAITRDIAAMRDPAVTATTDPARDAGRDLRDFRKGRLRDGRR